MMDARLLNVSPKPAAADVNSIDFTPTDVKVGDKYAVFLPAYDKPVMVEFRQQLTNGILRFTLYGTDMEIPLPKGEWDVMRSNGRACRIPDVAKRGRTAGEIEDIDPLSLLDPDEQNITLKEQAKRRLASTRLQNARTLRRYVLRYDENPAGAGHVGVRKFIDDNFDDARKAGFTWKPSPGALLSAVKECGLPGERPLTAFLSRTGRHDKSKRWPETTIDLAVAMNSAYWSKRETRKVDVISAFFDAFDKEDDRRAVLRKTATERGRLIGPDEEALVRPSKETLRLWINAGENYWSWRGKYGATSARRRFKGIGRAIEACQPLEYIMIDHTRIDAWAAIYDEDGTKVLVERPWLTLAIDVYSRMILGAVLTYEPPSVYSALLCLRQVVRCKDFLIDKYGYHKGATDGWGAPKTVICDNAWEFVGLSFQVCCEAAGINVIWAPVKTPEFKTYAERAFGILNELVWHRLEEGIPLKPGAMSAMGLKPETKAVHTREWMHDKMWDAIVTIYHLEEHGEKKIIPAKWWRDGLVADGRPTIDDVRELDKLLGRSGQRLLTTSGITFRTHRFHDAGITSELLDRLLRTAPKKRQRRGPHSSGVVPLMCTWDPSDCSFINVYDFALKKHIRLPNVDPEYSKGLSWKTAEKIKKFAHERNLDFQSDREKRAARAAFSRSLQDELPYLSYGEARKSAAELDKPQLIAGEYVNEVTIKPGTSETVDIPQVIPARERTGDRIADKGPRRGGKAATRASVKSRADNKARATAKAAQSGASTAKPATAPTTGLAVASMTDTEAMARLAALKDDLD
jgi:putative transposase